MAKTLVVFGATGQQGGSIIDHVLSDPELSKLYRIRAVTRDPHSEKASKLASKVEVVYGDVNGHASLPQVLSGAHTVFLMTTPSILQHAARIQRALRRQVHQVTPFDQKAQAEAYIRGLPIKSAFYCPGSFMENFQNQSFLAPKKRAGGDGSWVVARHKFPKTKMPLINAVGDTGSFVGAILAQSDKYEGARICAAVGFYTMEEVCSLISASAGQKIVFDQVGVEGFKRELEVMPEGFAEYFSFIDDYGCFGPGTEELVAEGAKVARGKLETFEEYLEAHAYRLE